MASIFVGSGLGWFDSSLTQLNGGGAVGNSGVGQGRDQAWVNAATGNLVINSQDEFIEAIGLDQALVRNYNSMGQQLAKPWRFSFQRTLGFLLPGILNGPITRTLGDDHVQNFTFDNGVWRSTDGADADDTITMVAGGGFQYREGGTGIVENYNSAGALISVQDQNGNTQTYNYDLLGTKVTSIVDSSGQTVFFDYGGLLGLNLTGIRVMGLTPGATGASSLQQVMRVSYGYDGMGRMSSVSFELTATATGFGDGNVYTTNYQYDGISNRISQISQSDGSVLAVTYQMVGLEYRVSTLTDALGHVTSFGYDTANRRTTVTDALGNATVYTYDTSNRLVQIMQPAIAGGSSSIAYQYDAAGNVSQVTDGLGRSVFYTYDGRSNLIRSQDALGNTVTRTYDADDRLLTETTYRQPAPSIGAAASEPQAAQYVYDAQHNLRFVVSAAGDVTEYRYDARGLQVASVSYPTAAYTSGAFALSDLTGWAGAQDQTKIRLVDTAYDLSGQIKSVTAWNATDLAGNGLNDGQQSTGRYVYDVRGRLLISIDPRAPGSVPTATAAAGQAYVTSYLHDGLDRVLSTQDATGRTNLTQYANATRTVTTTTAGGLVTTSVFNAAGDLISVSQSAPGSVALGTTTYAYDAEDRVVLTTDPTGQKTYTLYDARGRAVASVSPENELTETVYDDADQVIAVIRYATRISVNPLTASGNSRPLSEVRPAASTLDRTTAYRYDSAGRLVYEADQKDASTWYVTSHSYDGAGRKIAITQYVTALTAPPASAAAAITTASGDRTERYFYDADDRQVGTLDADGYLTETIYDAAGTVKQGTAYAGQSSAALRSSGTLDQLRADVLVANGVDNRSAYVLYDGQGRPIATIDALGYLAVTTYDVVGNATAVTRYASPVTYSGQPLGTLIALASVPGQNQATSASYDALNRVIQQTDFQGTITSSTYDIRGFLVCVTRAVGQVDALGRSDQRTTRYFYDGLGRVTNTLLGRGAAVYASHAGNAAQQAQDAQDWGTKVSYDLAGRKTRETDANGKTSLWYYDGDGRLRYAVNPSGEVTEYRYDAFGDVVDLIQYVTRINTSGLLGGLAAQDSAFTSQINYSAFLNHADNRQSHSVYADNRGLLTQSTDARGFISNRVYDAFGALLTQTVDTGATPGDAVRTDSFSYNARGLLTGTVEDSGGLNRSSQVLQYDAFGQALQTQDARGNITTTQYDKRGRVIYVTDPLTNTAVTTYDAFDRVLTTQDRLGQVTTYSYNDAQQSATVTTPEGLSVTTLANRHGQEIRVTDGTGAATTYSYDADGNLTSTLDANGNTISSAYDRAGLLSTTTDARGTITAYTYDAASRVLTRTVDPSGLNLSTSYAYDAFGGAFRVTDARGVITETVFDKAGRAAYVIVDTANLRLATSYAYNGLGNTVTVTEGLRATGVSGSWAFAAAANTVLRTTAYEYDKLGRRKKEIVDPGAGKLNLTTEYFYDGNDNVVRKIDANNQTWRYLYNANNWLVFTVDPTNAVTASTYDAEGRLTRNTQYANFNTAALTDVSLPSAVTVTSNPGIDRNTWQAYDRDGRLVYSIDATGAVTRSTYDAANRVTEMLWYATAISTASLGTGPTKATIDGLVNNADVSNRRSTTVYDAIGQAVYEVDALRNLTQNVYDASGNLIQAWAYASPLAGGVALTKPAIDEQLPNLQADAANRITATVYDAANRERYTLKVKSGGAGNWQTYVAESRYDGVGNVVDSYRYGNLFGFSSLASTVASVAATVAGNLNPVLDQHDVSVYDGAGRLTLLTDAESYNQSYTYDGLGNKLSYTNQNNATWTYIYDAAGRMTDEISPSVSVGTISQQPAVDGLAGATTSITSPDGNFVYVTGTNTLSVFQKQADGSLSSTPVQLITGGQSGAPPLTNAGSMALSPDGAYLYVLVPGDNSMSVFTRNAGTGQLSFLQRLQDNIGGADGLTNAQGISTVGNSVYVVSPSENSIVLFSRNATTGLLSFGQKYSNTNDAYMLGASSVAASPDGTSVYVFSGTTGNLMNLRRNASTGVLSYWTVTNGSSNLGITSGRSVLVSPDGKYTYLLGSNWVQPRVYVRNTTTGELSTIVDYGSGDTGMTGTSMKMSADGSTVVVSADSGTGSTANSTLYVYSRNGTSGSLTRLMSGNPLDSLRGASSGFSLSPNGQAVYSQWKTENRMLVQTRSATTLDVTQVFQQGASPLAVASTNVPVVTHISYDGLGNVTSRIENYTAANPAASRVTSYQYDTVGRQSITRSADQVILGGVTYGSYATGFSNGLSAGVNFNAFGDATVSLDAGGRYSYKVYDTLGRVQYEIDADGYVTAYGYNAFGDQTTVTRHANAVSAGHVAGTAYTPAEVLTRLSAISSDRLITTAYDALGRKTSVIEPAVYVYDSDTQTSTTASPTTSFAYNAFGDVVRQDEAGHSAAASSYSYYDRLGRKVAAVDTMGYLSQWAYTATGKVLEQKEWGTALAAGTWNDSTFAVPTSSAAAVSDQQLQTQWQSVFATGITGLTTSYPSNFYTSGGNLTVRNGTGGSAMASIQGTRNYTGSSATPQTIGLDFTITQGTPMGERYIGIGNWNGVSNLSTTFGIYLRINANGGYIASSGDLVMFNAGSTTTIPIGFIDNGVALRMEFIVDATGASVYLRTAASTRNSVEPFRFNTTTVPSFRTQIFARQTGSGSSESMLSISSITESLGDPRYLDADSLANRVIGTLRQSVFTQDRLNRQTSTTQVGVVKSSLSANGAVQSTVGNVTISSQYDGVGNIIASTDAGGAVSLSVYDALGRQTAIIGPEKSTQLPDGTTTNVASLVRYAYDALGNQIAQTQYVYGAEAAASQLPRKIDALRDATSFSRYDILGRVSETIDAEGYKVTFGYDAYGNVSQMQRIWLNADGSTGQQQETYSYNGRGLLTSKTELQTSGTIAAQNTVYNAFGEVTAKGMSGTGNTLLDGLYEQYAYDNAGRLILSNENGVDTVYLYDRRGRSTAQITSPTADLSGSITGNSPQPILGLADLRRVETVYDALGRATSQRDASFTQTSLQSRLRLSVVQGNGIIPANLTFSNEAPIGSTTTIRIAPIGTTNWTTIVPQDFNGVWNATLPSTVTVGTYQYEIKTTLPNVALPVSTQSGTILLQALGVTGFGGNATGITTTVETRNGLPYYVFTPGSGISLAGVSSAELYDVTHGSIRVPTVDLGSGKIGVLVGDNLSVNAVRFFGSTLSSGQSIRYAVTSGLTPVATANSSAQSLISSLFLGTLSPTLLGSLNLKVASVETKAPDSGEAQTYTLRTLPAQVSLRTLDIEDSAFDYRIQLLDATTNTPIDLSGYLFNGQPLGNSTGFITGTYRNDYSTSQTVDAVPTNQESVTYTPTSQQAYDRWANVIERTDAAGVTSTFRYDEWNRLIETKNESTEAYNDRGVASTVTPTYETAYDVMGRVIAGTDANRNYSSQSWDAAGNLIKSTEGIGYSTTYGYDSLNRRLSETDPLNNRTVYNYNRLGQISSQKNGAQTTADVYYYDALGNRTGDNRGQVSYVYDAWGHIIKELRPSTVGGATRVTGRSYDARGQQTGQTDALNNSEAWSYDYFGRLKSHTSLTGNNSTGVIGSVGDPTTYTYDETGAVTEERLTTGGKTYVKRYAYYANGQLKSVYDAAPEDSTLGNASLQRTDYAYDAGNRLLQKRHSVLAKQSGLFVATQYNWFAYENDVYRYDSNGRLAEDSNWITNVKYFYDAQGNRKLIASSYSDYGNGTLLPVQRVTTYRYRYDANNRVTREDSLEAQTRNGTTTRYRGTTTRLYFDKGGNRIQEMGYSVDYAGASSTQNLYDGLDATAVSANLKSNALNSYDAALRLVTGNDYTKSVYISRVYNDLNQVTRYRTVQGTTYDYVYTYNADGSIQQQNYEDSTGWYVKYLYAYDAAGNLLTNTQRGLYNNDFVNTTTYTYQLGEGGYLEKSIVITGSGAGTTTNSYNFRDQLARSVQPLGSHTMYYDTQGKIFQKVYSNANNSSYNERDFLIFHGDQQVGRYIRNQEGSTVTVTADFGFEYEPVSQAYPSITPSQYVVISGDTLQMIAQKLYGDANLWYLIADANSVSSSAALPAGLTLKIPNAVVNAGDNASTFKPYNPGEIIGDLTPIAPQPSSKKCNTFATVLIAVVAIVATVYTAGVAATAFGATTTGTFAAGTAALGGSVAGLSTGSALAAAAIGGAVGSAVSQGVAISLGVQDKFSFGQVALGALGAAASAGIGRALDFAKIGASTSATASQLFQRGALQGALNSVAQNGIGSLITKQAHFSWASVAAGAISSGIGAGLGFNTNNVAANTANGFAKNMVAGFVTGIARSAVTVAIQGRGKIDVLGIAADSFGNALGNSLVSAGIQKDFENRYKQLGAYGRRVYENALQNGQTAQQALADATDLEGALGPNWTGPAAQPNRNSISVTAMQTDMDQQLAELSRMADRVDVPEFEVAEETKQANQDVAGLNQRQGNDGWGGFRIPPGMSIGEAYQANASASFATNLGSLQNTSALQSGTESLKAILSNSGDHKFTDSLYLPGPLPIARADIGAASDLVNGALNFVYTPINSLLNVFGWATSPFDKYQGELITLESSIPGGAQAPFELATTTLATASRFLRGFAASRVASEVLIAAKIGERGADLQVPVNATSGIPVGVTYEGPLYRAVPVGGEPLDISFSVKANGRYTAPGQGGLYFSSNAGTVEAEFINNGSSLVGRNLNVFSNSSIDNLLDLTNPMVRNELGVSLQDITRTGGTSAWRYEFTQPLGAFAEINGYSGLIAPSAQADGSVNLILFGSKGVK